MGLKLTLCTLSLLLSITNSEPSCDTNKYNQLFNGVLKKIDDKGNDYDLVCKDETYTVYHILSGPDMNVYFDCNDETFYHKSLTEKRISTKNISNIKCRKGFDS